MKRTTQKNINISILFLVMFLGLSITFAIIYSDINDTKQAAGDVKSILHGILQLDEMGSSIGFIKLNENSLLLEDKKQIADDIRRGYARLFLALDSLKSSPAFSDQQRDVFLLDSLIREKFKVSDQIISLSRQDQNAVAMDIFKHSNDSLLLTEFGKARGRIFSKVTQRLYGYQEEHIRETDRIFRGVIITMTTILVFLLYSFWQLIKQMKEKDRLLSSNKIGQQIINSTFDPIVITDPNLIITYCNPATEKLFGISISNMIGRTADEVFRTVATKDQIEERIAKIKDQGYWVGQLIRRNANNSAIHLKVSINSIKDENEAVTGFFAIYTDVTELNRAQEEIKTLAISLSEKNATLVDQVESQALLIKEVFDRVKGIFVGTNRENQIVYSSRNVKEFFYLIDSDGQLEGKDIGRLLRRLTDEHNAGLPAISYKYQEQKSFDFIHPFNGQWYHAGIFPSPKGISIYFSDISQIKKAEENILRSKQMFEFISRTNELILHATNEMDLYGDICELAVTFENIIFTWVGIPDENNRLKPVYWFGKEDGYIEVATSISLNDNTSTSQGPAGRAIRSGQSYYCNDIANDPMMLPWRDEALKRGYQSSIALPIRVNGKTRALLSLYASVPYYFSEEHLLLLENVSENMSFALQTFYIEQQQKESEAQLHKMMQAIEQSSASIMITDIKGIIEYVNPAFCKLSGYDFNEVTGKHSNILKTGITKQEDYDSLWQNLHNKSEWHGEFCNRKKNGEIFWEYAVISPIFNESGEVINYIAVKENITERKRLEEEQVKMTNDLLQRNRDLEQFSFILSHNIRGPLSTIMGLKTVLDNETSPANRQMILDGISQSVDVMDKVLRDVTAILNMRKLSLEEKTQVDFGSIYHSVVESLQDLLDEKNVHIEIDFSQCMSCFSMKSYLKSIFSNLIENAIKFSKRDQRPEISIWTELEDDTVRIHFKDNGLGIDLEKHGTALFGLYKQFNKNIQGRGLGLFLVKSQVEYLGGDIQVKSQLHEWTEFIVSLPMQTSEHP